MGGGGGCWEQEPPGRGVVVVVVVVVVIVVVSSSSSSSSMYVCKGKRMTRFPVVPDVPRAAHTPLHLAGGTRDQAKRLLSTP